MRKMGMPQRMIPTPNGPESRREPTRLAAAKAPARPPIPTAALRNPTPASPARSSSRAETISKTLKAPAANV
jgi:hypothetical protein